MTKFSTVSILENMAYGEDFRSVAGTYTRIPNGMVDDNGNKWSFEEVSLHIELKEATKAGDYVEAERIAGELLMIAFNMD